MLYNQKKACYIENGSNSFSKEVDTMAKKSLVNAASILKSIAAIGSEKPSKSANQKWEMTLTPDARILAQRWVNAKSVFDPIEIRLKSSKENFCDYALEQMAIKLFSTKSRPSNPLICLDNGTQFQFTLSDKFTFDKTMPKDADPKEHYVDMLTGVGLTHENATELVENEFELEPVVGLRNFNEMLNGRYGEGREFVESSALEKSAGEKIAAFLQWDGNSKTKPEAMTDEERAVAVECSSGLKIKAGFLERVATYCRNVDELMGVFTIVKPVIYPGSLKFAEALSESERVSLRQSNANEILGSTTSKKND